MENARNRARAVKKSHGEQAPDDGPLVLATPNGDVSIEALTIVEDGTRSRVEVRVSDASGGDPNFVIVNPPTLVPDQFGEHVVHGRRFREDPIAAVAYVVAQHGGSIKKQKDARRGLR